MVTSVRWLFFSLLVFLLFACSLHSKPLHEWGNGIGSAANNSAVNNTEDGTEEISKKEYDTVHGRVLAVNMALMTKKVNESKNRNILESRSQDNENMRMFVQGDMHIDQELYDYIKSGGNSRNAIRARKRLWTSRIIPYHIPSYMNHITSNVQKAIQEFHRKSCLRFVRYHSAYHRNYITFGNSYGCSSRIGKRYAEAGRQTISIGDGCNFVGTIIHEMMHAIGFFHEQARSDRDKYVKIYWENILSGFSDQFDKYSWRTIDDLGVSYDYESVMHYSRKAFTRNGKPTIVAVGNENMEFGTPDDLLSTRDALEINALYDCKTKSHGWTTWSRWTPCDDNCYRRRERFCYNSGNLKSCGGNVNLYGIETQKLKCPSSICPAPIHGHWGRWSEWRPCSKTCNDGTKTRWRRCNNPQPAHGGKQCPGNSTERGMCILKRCHLDFDDADFENRRLGMWTNSQGNKINWQFHKFFTKTVDTGPDRDHTSGQGYYLYMESSSRIGGSRAELVSPWIPVRKSGQCFKFYYAMYGKTMGSLAVKLEISNGNNWYIFYKTGNQGYGWKRGIGNIDLQLGLRYRLKIIGKVGQVGYSDIAIDDVYIDPGLCSCQDDFYTCHLWASKGECSRNENWMKNNCKRSCKVCGVPPSSCVDSDPTQCPPWAANGECKKNPGWMLKHCRKSCKTCGGVSSSCQDANINCPAWAKIGECEKNPRWMLPNCKLSCKQC